MKPIREVTLPEWLVIFLICIVVLMASVVSAFGQQPAQAPPVIPMPPQAPPVESKYRSFWQPNYFPVVVFVGCEPRDVPGITVCVEPLGFAGSSKPCVIVFKNRKSGERFPASLEDWQIIRAAGLEVQAPVPVPFPASSGHQDQAVAADADAKGDSSSPWLPEPEQKRLRALLPKAIKGEPRFYSLRPLYQKMYTMNNGTSRFNVPTGFDNDWPRDLMVSGGMDGLHGWKSFKALDIPAGKKIAVWKEDTDVRAYSLVPRWRWRFPVGTVAYDVLLNDDGKVIEARTQTRSDDGWETKVYKGDGTPPANYAGAGRACASCHDRAGTLRRVPDPSYADGFKIYLHNIWGDDGRLSFRPYRGDGSLDYRLPIEVK